MEVQFSFFSVGKNEHFLL